MRQISEPFDLDLCASSTGGSPVRFTQLDDGLSLVWSWVLSRAGALFLEAALVFEVPESWSVLCYICVRICVTGF